MHTANTQTSRVVFHASRILQKFTLLKLYVTWKQLNKIIFKQVIRYLGKVLYETAFLLFGQYLSIILLILDEAVSIFPFVINIVKILVFPILI